MSELHKLGDSLRGHYDDQQFPIGEKDWDRAAAMISAARRKRGIIYSLSILALLIPALWFLFSEIPSEQEIAGNKAGLSVSTSNIGTANGEASPLPAPVKSVEVKATEHPELKSSRKTHAVTAAAGEQSEISPAGTASELTVKKNKAAVTINKSQPVRTGQSPANEFQPAPQVMETKQSPEVKEAQAVAEVNKSALQPPSATKEIKQEISENRKPEFTLVPVTNENDPLSKNTEKPLTEKNTVEIDPMRTESSPKSENEKPVSNDVTAAQPAGIAPIAGTSQAIPPAVLTESTAAARVNISSPGALDSLLKPGQDDGIFIEAGGIWFNGWLANGVRDARGFSPLLGFNYQHKPAKLFTLSFGVQYYQVPALMNSSKTSRISHYNYGEESEVTVITPSALHYLGIPLRFQYDANSRNSIGVGVNFAYLITVDANVQTHDEKPGFKGNYNNMTLNGYTQGFSWFDSQVALYYRRNIGQHFGIQGEVFFGLTDIKEDHFFTLNARENNSGVKIALIYYAFAKKAK
jgi:hypothetical protein